MKQNKPLVFIPTLALFFILNLLSSAAYCADKDTRENFPVIELQSQLMSFADQLMAEISQATNQYLLDGEKKSVTARMAVTNARLNASTAAVSIASGKNPEVALLDMIVLVKLYTYTIEDVWIPKLLGSEATVFLEAFSNLEKQLMQISSNILSQQQIKELNGLLVNWRKQHKDSYAAVANVRFSEFSANRYDSSLFDKGEAGGFLKKVGDATQELERTRLLAERAIFLAERQIKLLSWQVEQVFYNLAVTNEFNSLIDGVAAIPDSANSLANNVNKLSDEIENIHQIIDFSSDTSLHQMANGLSLVFSQVLKNIMNDIKLTLFLWLLIALLTIFSFLLLYKYLSLKMEQKYSSVL